MNNSNKIGLIVLVLLTLFVVEGCTYSVLNNENNSKTDAIKFMEEYSDLNGKINESTQSVDCHKNNVAKMEADMHTKCFYLVKAIMNSFLDLQDYFYQLYNIHKWIISKESNKGINNNDPTTMDTLGVVKKVSSTLHQITDLYNDYLNIYEQLIKYEAEKGPYVDEIKKFDYPDNFLSNFEKKYKEYREENKPDNELIEKVDNTFGVLLNDFLNGEI